MSPHPYPVEATSPATSHAVENRRAPRYPILQRCFVRPPGALGREGWHCIGHNISVTGIGITLPTPLAQGTLVEIEAWGLPRARLLKARVIYLTPLEFVWLCGCELTVRLTDEELQTWRAGRMDWVPAD